VWGERAERTLSSAIDAAGKRSVRGVVRWHDIDAIYEKGGEP
jgi:hypothetical protein